MRRTTTTTAVLSIVVGQVLIPRAIAVETGTAALPALQNAQGV